MVAYLNKSAAEAQIRKLIDDSVRATRAKDVEWALAAYAPDVVSFDVVDPLRYLGADAVKRRLGEWLSSFQDGPIGFEMSDLTIAAGDDVAFCHGLNHVDAMRTDGQKLDMWWRATLCFRKIEGNWQVTHSHSSAPFNVETGKPSLDLKP